MAIEQKYIDLINADIDDEIGADDQAALQAFLAGSAEGRALHDELSALCTALDGVSEVEPPPHLRHVIMNAIPPERPAERKPGFLQVLLATPALKYAATFAAGVFLTLSIVDSSQVADHAFDDVAGLVGTMAQPVDTALASTISVDELDVAGTVSLRSAGSLLILDFDLVSEHHIDIEAGYTDPSIWFNGFAQLESEDTTISAAPRRVTLGMKGKRRYAVFLHNQGGRQMTVNLRFLAGGEVIHEASLEYDPAD